MSTTSDLEAALKIQPKRGTVEHALWLVRWHFEWENPVQVQLLRHLYTDDIVWELPSAGLTLNGKDEVIDNYVRTFEVLGGSLKFQFIDHYATADRVFDDREAHFVVEDIEKFPMKELNIRQGETVRMRLSHSFHIRDGLISRENVYQIIVPR